VVTEALDLQQLAVHAVPEFAQVGEIVEPFVDIEVVRVVDRGLGPERALVLEILASRASVCSARGDWAARRR
jgi:hypothetical protein